MRKIAWIMVGAALLWPLSLSAQSETYDGSSFARITYVKGEVTVFRAGDLGSEEASINMALVEGDRIGSREGRAEVDFGRKNFLRLDRGTEVEISNLPQGGDDRIRLHLLSGRMYLRITSLDREKNIEVHTPDASYYVLEPGLYRLEARSNAQTELAVLEGSIEAAGEEGSQLISSRERQVASNGHLGSQGSFSYSRDDFDYFNEDRDTLHSQYVSRQYLPSELGDYEEELSDNGSWVYEQPYGYVWTPTVTYSDWHPYYYGRWDYYASCGWTWIPEESWGWPVYHYGRWQWRLGLGWYWIPHVSWGPAWVNWYHGDDYWGWCPLSWYNYPSVLVDNYYYDRYHGSHYPGHNRAMTVVHKNQLQDRHISNVALSRLQASRLGDINLEARQPGVRPAIGRSGLKDAGSLTGGARPQIRSFERTLDRSSLGSPSRVTGRPGAVGGSSGSINRSDSRSTVSPGSLSSGGRITSYPRSSAGSRSVNRPAAETTQAAPRRGPQSGVSPRSGTPANSSGVRSFSSSPKVSSSDRASGVQRRESTRRYSPSASVTRFGNSTGLGSPRSLEGPSRSTNRDRLTGRSASVSRGNSGTGYRPAPWPPSPYTVSRLEKSYGSSANGSRSYSSGRYPQGRTYSTPNRSYSGSGGYYSAPSRSSSAPSRSYSAPSRSSSSAGRSFSSPRSSSGSGSSRSISRGSSGASSHSSSRSSSSSSSSRGSGGHGSRRG